MVREEAITDEMILISEREGGREGRGAGMKHFVHECEAGVPSTDFALTCGGFPRLRGLLCKFQWQLFPKGAELGRQELEQAPSGQLLEDLGASREKERQNLLECTPSSDAPQSPRQHSSIPRTWATGERGLWAAPVWRPKW